MFKNSLFVFILNGIPLLAAISIIIYLKMNMRDINQKILDHERIEKLIEKFKSPTLEELSEPIIAILQCPVIRENFYNRIAISRCPSFDAPHKGRENDFVLVHTVSSYYVRNVTSNDINYYLKIRITELLPGIIQDNWKDWVGIKALSIGEHEVSVEKYTVFSDGYADFEYKLVLPPNSLQKIDFRKSELKNMSDSLFFVQSTAVRGLNISVVNELPDRLKMHEPIVHSPTYSKQSKLSLHRNIIEVNLYEMLLPGQSIAISWTALQASKNMPRTHRDIDV